MNAALPEIIRNKGHVVVVASVYAFANGVGTAPYAMAKAGVEQLGRALRIELAQHGAGASVAYFGFIDTEMVRESIDRDPLAARLWATIPRVLQKRLPPRVAGEAIAAGIERRQARIIRPRRWTILSVFRGVLNPLIPKGDRPKNQAIANDALKFIQTGASLYVPRWPDVQNAINDVINKEITPGTRTARESLAAVRPVIEAMVGA